MHKTEFCQSTDQSLPDEKGDVNDDKEDKENGDADSGDLWQAAPRDAVALSHENQHQDEDHVGGSLEQATWKPDTPLNKVPSWEPDSRHSFKQSPTMWISIRMKIMLEAVWNRRPENQTAEVPWNKVPPW